MKKIKRAIISVTDKAGIKEFAKALSEKGVEIISTGGTAKLLLSSGLPVIPIESYTGFPEMLGGRVKTLHPKVLGGILGIRANKEHQEQMKNYDILPIDMVVVNLYAFEETVKKGAPLQDAIENIDIGGPTLIRSAAKNYEDVAIVTEPTDYDSLIEEMRTNDGSISSNTRFSLAKKAFQLTARYDAAISNYLGAVEDGAKTDKFPETFTVQFTKAQDLRYGENPHQKATLYREREVVAQSLVNTKQLQGKELSFNNILDLNSAYEIILEFQEPAAVILKHNNPCGVAVSKEGIHDAYLKALSCDSVSAFGGIISLNQTVDKIIAEEMTKLFLEAIVAPGFSSEALEIFKKKKNLRILEAPPLALQPNQKKRQQLLDIKRVTGGALLQRMDMQSTGNLKVVTTRRPGEKELADLLFAWNVCKHVKSNAIVFAKNAQTIGIGAGQMSRIDSTRIAVLKAADAGLKMSGTAMASDAFFPFRDNVDKAAEVGAMAIIQPGGSIRDAEVIEAANEHGLAMVFTGMRHFKH